MYDFDEEIENFDDIEDCTEKDRSRMKRRKRDWEKAIARFHKDKHISNFGKPRYDNVHQYSKNKIHCSCLMCAFNGKKHGRVVFKTETYSDMKKRLSAEEQIAEYKTA